MLKGKSPNNSSSLHVKITNFDSHGTMNSAQCRAPIFLIPEASLPITISTLTLLHLVDLFLLVDAIFAGSTVDKQEESSNDGQDLEEVVFGKIFVRVVLMELERVSKYSQKGRRQVLQSRSC